MNSRPKWKKQIGKYFVKFRFNLIYQDKKERKKERDSFLNILKIKHIKKCPLDTKLRKH